MHIFNQVRRLQWKWTLSFAIVATCVVMIINTGSIIVALYNGTSNSLSVAELHQILEPLVGQTSYYVKVDPPDIERLSQWADQLFMSSELLLPPDDTSTVTMLPTIDYVALLDSNGELLIEEGFGLMMSDVLTSESNSLLQGALSGEEGLNHHHAELELTILFLPVRDEDGILAVAVVGVSLVTADANTLLSFWPELVDNLLISSLVSMMMGMFFGYFASRGQVRRLQTLEKTADAWAKGEFSLKVYDKSGDEIGQLARHFNFMADQLSMLMDTRTQLAGLEERGRMARDLHDTVKQQVFALHMQLSSAKLLLHHDIERTEQILNQTLQLNKQTQQDLAELIHALRPVALEEKGLAHAIEGYATEWSARSGISSELFTQNNQALPLTSEYALYRIVQEALANVAKHAQAQQVNIQLTWQPKQFILRIQDDGVGFDVTSERKKGYGLRSMNERLAELGGEVKIESTIGEGSTVTATLPIGKKDK